MEEEARIKKEVKSEFDFDDEALPTPAPRMA